MSRFTQSLPIVSDGSPILNGYELNTYKEIVDDMVFSFSFYGRAINSLTDDDVRVSKRLFLPSSKLRGFEAGKIGPKDSRRLYRWKLRHSNKCSNNSALHISNFRNNGYGKCF